MINNTIKRIGIKQYEQSKCIVDWYDGSTTKEIIIGQTNNLYLFNYHENNNYFAPKSWCSIINIT